MQDKKDENEIKNANVDDDIKVYDIKNHITEKKLKKISLTKSFNYAIEGVIHTLRHERNMKIHYFGAMAVLIAALFFDFSKIELIALFFCISLVIICEMLNTAVEKVVDMVIEKFDKRAKVAKDVAAGAVLISAVNAVIVGYLLFLEKLKSPFEHFMFKIRQTNSTLTFIIIVIVILITIIIKTVYGGGTPMSGGMPSGHTALGFSVATIIALNQSDVLTATLCYFLAFLVAQSRIEGRIHSIIETIVGGLIGFLTALLIYGILK